MTTQVLSVVDYNNLHSDPYMRFYTDTGYLRIKGYVTILGNSIRFTLAKPRQ